jgi:hypothetical protein
MKILPAAVLALTLTCAAASSALAETELAPPLGDSTAWQKYGEAIQARRARSLGKVLAKPGRHLERPMLLEGEVSEVCAKKGCWMVLSDGERQVRVTFEDYGFFVPRDIDGVLARVEGVLSERLVPIAEVRHYLEDAGRHEEAALVTRPERSYTFVATGVMLRRQG